MTFTIPWWTRSLPCSACWSRCRGSHCTRTWFFDFRLNTEFFGAIHGIPRNFTEFRGIMTVKFCEIPRNSVHFCIQNSVHTSWSCHTHIPTWSQKNNHFFIVLEGQRSLGCTWRCLHPWPKLHYLVITLSAGACAAPGGVFITGPDLHLDIWLQAQGAFAWTCLYYRGMCCT
jgi:hypothetical protein